MVRLSLEKDGTKERVASGEIRRGRRRTVVVFDEIVK